MPQDQFYTFLFMVGIGLVVGFCSDFYRVTRLILGLRRMGSSIGDLLFWLLLTPMVFGMLLFGNWGEFRLYVILGLGCGLLLYFKLISPIMVSALQKFYKILKKLWFWFMSLLAAIWRVITLPARMVVLVLGLPVQAGTKVGIMLWQPVARHVTPGIKTRWVHLCSLPGRVAARWGGKKTK